LLDIIILCPIIYLDYFWCIKYQCMHKYVKIGKEMEKGTKKRVSSASWAGGGGGIRPSRSARGRMGRWPTWPASGGNGTGTASWARAHLPLRRGGTVLGGDRGRTGRSSTAGEAPWRFSIGVPVLRRWSGGKAWAGVGDYCGGDNLARGRLGWPVHGEVAGVRGGRSPARDAGRNR
jgi:hypothetical protein